MLSRGEDSVKSSGRARALRFFAVNKCETIRPFPNSLGPEGSRPSASKFEAGVANSGPENSQPDDPATYFLISSFDLTLSVLLPDASPSS